MEYLWAMLHLTDPAPGIGEWLRRKLRFAMPMVFLDESSNFGQQDFVCVAGYIADDAQWASFAQEWRLLLGKHKLASLHTADFLAGQAEYRKMGLDQTARHSIIQEFIGAIRKHLPAGFAVGIDAAHFRGILADQRKRIKPEVFCFQRILRLVTEKLREWQIADDYDLFFDDVPHYAMKLYSFLCDLKHIDSEARDRIRTIAFGKDEKWPPLQAADLLCCATAREQRFGFGQKAWDEQRSLFRPILLDEDPAYGKPYFNEYWDQERLDKFADIIKSAATGAPSSASERQPS
jgi:hypothetical protein